MLTYNRYGLPTLTFLIVAIVYLLSLQTIPNGSSDPYMIDVGETQVALNVWGTMHPTGYPLYAILGNIFSPIPQFFGVNPATSTSLFSMLWTLLALLGLYGLLLKYTGQPLIAASVLLVLAFARSIWIHSVIAEVYSLSLAILVAIWIVLVYEPLSFRNRVWWLAFLLGIGISHHRAVAFAGFGIAFVMLPLIKKHLQDLKSPSLILGAIGLFALGFLPYLYAPLRTNSEWSYAKDLNTWDGFWFYFWGREADYLITTPSDLQGWIDNFSGTLEILVREITVLGLILSVVCTGVAVSVSRQTWFARMTALSGLGFFAFAVAYHQAVLPEAIVMMMLPSFVVAIALTLDWLSQKNIYAGWVGVGMVVLWATLLIPHSKDFIQNLTDDPTGLRSIQAAREVPQIPDEEPVFMLSWGPRYFAASYSRLVTGENDHLQMVDHTADFAELAADGKTIYTEPDTLYGYPLAWWEERFGKLYLTSMGADLVRLGRKPVLDENMNTSNLIQYMEAGIWLSSWDLLRDEDGYILAVRWYAESKPDRDLSVKAHLTRADSPVPLIQADSNAPVYGWRPTSTWLAGEIVQDHYRFPCVDGAAQIILGMYEQLPSGEFANYGDTVIPLSACQ